MISRKKDKNLLYYVQTIVFPRYKSVVVVNNVHLSGYKYYSLNDSKTTLPVIDQELHMYNYTVELTADEDVCMETFKKRLRHKLRPYEDIISWSEIKKKS